MGVREKLNKNRGPILVIGIVCLVLSIFFITWQLQPSRPHLAGIPEKSFYSDDDGGTYFIDDFLKIAPFDHNGKAACRALVYQCKDNKPAVGYLARFSAAQKAQLEAIGSDNRNDFTRAFMALQGAMDVKKPGSRSWLSVGEKGYINETIVTCPDGSAEGSRIVLPSDPDSGARG